MTLAVMVVAAAAAMSSTLALVNGVAGFLVPHAIAFVNHARWRPQIKASVAFALCLGAALATCAATGKLTPTDWALSAMTVFGVAQVSYRGLWKPTGISDRIEKKTSPSAGDALEATDPAPVTEAEQL